MPDPIAPTPSPRSLKWRAYGVVRPVLRPIAHRLRTFFVGPLHDELAELRAELRALRDTLDRERATADQHVRDVLAQALATLALDRER